MAIPADTPEAHSTGPLRSTPAISLCIHGMVLAIWVFSLAAGFRLHGVFAWSVGIIYISYDIALIAFVSWQMHSLQRPDRQAGETQGPACSRVCIIVAAYNESEMLPATIAALLNQSIPADQIIIADDGSDDATAALLTQRYGFPMPDAGRPQVTSTDHPSLQWLKLAHGGKARALNAAIAATDCDIVVTVDADTLPAPTAVAAMRQAFAANLALVAATGILAPVCDLSLRGRLFCWFQTYEYIRNFLARHAWAQLHSLLLVSGAFAGFRREALVAAGGFDPDSLVEDYELIHRLYRYAAAHGLHWEVTVLASATADTAAPQTTADFLRQRSRWFGGFLQTHCRYRDMVGASRYGKLGTVMLPVKAIDTLQPAYGLGAVGAVVYYVLAGRWATVRVIALFIAVKIAIDMVFHLCSARAYERWVATPVRIHAGYIALAACAEPFSFQILRHTGAALGWLMFLSGRKTWHRRDASGPDSRRAIRIAAMAGNHRTWQVHVMR